MAKDVPIGRLDEPAVRRLWWGALDTLQEELLGNIEFTKGLWIASPLPDLYDPKLLDRLQGWVWAPEELPTLQAPHSSFLLPSRVRSVDHTNQS